MYEKKRFTSIVAVNEILEKYLAEDIILQKCRECSGFAQTWSCPDFTFKVKDYWKQFSTFNIIVDRISMKNAKTPDEALNILYYHKPKFNSEMLKLEGANKGSKALYAQECEECKTCARLTDEKCRKPNIMRYSVESLGVYGVRLVKDVFGFDVQWSDGKSIPKYYILLGGILKP